MIALFVAANTTVLVLLFFWSLVVRARLQRLEQDQRESVKLQHHLASLELHQATASILQSRADDLTAMSGRVAALEDLVCAAPYRTPGMGLRSGVEASADGGEP